MFLENDDFMMLVDPCDLEIYLDCSRKIRKVSERIAITKMRDVLGNRYDIAHEFESYGANRNPILILYVMDMCLYHMARLSENLIVSKDRAKRYSNVLEWIEKVGNGEITPEFAKLPLNTELIIVS